MRLQKEDAKWSLKTEQNVNLFVARILKFEISYFFLRVWSWLRMNAGGMPKTCKSNEVAQKYLMTFEVLALISDLFGFGFST